MTTVLLLLYLVTSGLWLFYVQRERTIGIGVRYLSVVNYSAQFLLGPVMYWASGDLETLLNRPKYLETLYLIFAGFGAFIIGGYVMAPWWLRRRLRRQRIPPPTVQSLDLDRQWQLAIAVLVAGVLAQALTSLAANLPTVRAVWSQMVLFINTGAIMMCVNGLQTGRRVRIVCGFVSLLISGMYTSLASGFFGASLIALFYYMSLVLLSRGTRWRSWGALLVVGAVGLVPYNMWLTGRGALRIAIAQDAPMAERFDAFWSTTRIPGFSELHPTEQASYIRARMDQSELLAAAVLYTPEVEPYARGETLWWPVLVAIVPRALWPDKPLSLGGSEFVSRFTGWQFNSATSIGLHPIFEFYVNFGPVGAFIALGLLGFLAGVLDAMYWWRGGSNLTVQIVVIQSAWILVSSARLAEMAMSAPATLIAALAVSQALEYYITAQARRQTVQLGEPRMRQTR